MDHSQATSDYTGDVYLRTVVWPYYCMGHNYHVHCIHIDMACHVHDIEVLCMLTQQIQVLMLCPVCSHFAEYIWSTLLGKVKYDEVLVLTAYNATCACTNCFNNVCILVMQPKSVMYALWPDVGPVDDILLQKGKYLVDVSHELRVRLKRMIEIHKKVGDLSYMYICTFYLYLQNHTVMMGARDGKYPYQWITLLVFKLTAFDDCFLNSQANRGCLDD